MYGNSSYVLVQFWLRNQKNTGKGDHEQTTIKHNKLQTVHVILGMCSTIDTRQRL